MSAAQSGPQSVSSSGATAEQWQAEPRRSIALMEALAIARRSVEALTAQAYDSIAHSERTADGGWSIVVDTVEARARMGNNDLIAAWQVTLAADGELLAYSRQRRYHREDRERA